MITSITTYWDSIKSSLVIFTLIITHSIIM